MPELLPDAMTYFDHLQPVTYREAGIDAGVTVAGLKRGLQQREAEASAGRYLASDVHWHLPAAALGRQPGVGATLIEEDGTVWTILEVRAASLAGRWQCLARRHTLALGLDRPVALQRAVWTRDAHGAPQAAWVWERNLRARIQPLEEQAALQHDAPATVRRYRVWLSEAIPLDGSRRLVAEGQVYRLEKTLLAARLDRLFELQVVAE